MKEALAPAKESAADAAGDSPIGVFLLVENRLLLQALVRLLRKRPDLLIVGQSEQAQARTMEIAESKCDVLLSSVFPNWLLTNAGAEGEGRPGFRAVLIGMDLDEEQFLTAVRCGVTGYLLKDASAADIVTAVRAVFRGEAICPPQLCSALFRLAAMVPKGAQGGGTRPELTLRQQQLVSLIAKGLTNKEIASQLNLSRFTVRNHIHRILKQVDARSRSQAVETIRAHGYAIGA